MKFSRSRQFDVIVAITAFRSSAELAWKFRYMTSRIAAVAASTYSWS